jgi:predicted SnoaL-like aldol condensation-catalyzing enzyme
MDNNNSRKQQVQDLLKSIETGESAPANVINPNKYIQHNLSARDGLQGFAELMAQLPPNSARVNTVRIFEDGDTVFAHSEYDFFGPKVGFDIFRFEDGKIVEHWDNLQEMPATPNPSGHTMTDGPTQSTDLERTEQNKELIRQFLEDNLVRGNMDQLDPYYEGGNYIQHNPQLTDNVSGLRQGLQALADQGITVKFDKIHQVLGEGNFVLVVSEGNFAGQQSSFYDLFRVKNGKIAEHWDTTETIPPREQWKNDNGKF